ncbi:DUF3080 family protein [Agarivorans gilvus]|uniref:DUF3080 domain-containing protein n=1 Tax=Agarivorans gilvus TaxID=680279 RepID=A0ABQ1HTZ1_9ALTE|nr:DUF3080 family protein [Agarivorans gilvus]GGA91517.1 hypothetical protein GCM10007414_00140 [Agarivorans gilvus]
MSKAKVLHSGLLLLIVSAGLYLLVNWLSPPSERLFSDYSARLNRVLDISIEPPPSQAALPQISWRDFHGEEPNLNLSLLDSMSLHACGLDQLVFEANSSLGKVASADYRLIWHSQIIQGLNHCISSQQLKPALNQKLKNILALKRRHLAVYWNNYLSQDAAIQRLWQGNTRLTESPTATYRKLSEQLQQLLDIGEQFNQAKTIDANQVLALNKQLASAPSLRALAQELSAASRWLVNISQALQQRQFSCQQHRQDFIILQNILNKVYMPRVQAYLAELDQSLNLLNAPLAELFKQQGLQHLPAAMQQIQADFHQANRQHVKQWQRILNSCGDKSSN